MAIIIDKAAPGGQRTPLADILPLNTPILIQFFPVYACTFRCKYCVFSIPREDRGFISNKTLMDYELYTKCIEDLKEFPNTIKVIRFVGMGEPLLHKNIADMVAYAKQSGRAERTEILTNADLLSNAMSDSIIAAGLDRLVISLQGTTSERYEEVSNVNIDMAEFVNNIRYLYKHKDKLHIYIKIIDVALRNDEDKLKFYDMFVEICDSMSVEHASPIYPGVEMNSELVKEELTQFGLTARTTKVCPQPFFTMQINPDGNVVPCYSIAYPEIIGNCTKESLYDIWNGEKLRNFRLNMLDEGKSTHSICRECNINKYRIFPEDDIDSVAESLKSLY